MKTKFITQSAVICAIYVALSWIFAPISFGHNLFQFRISEALTVLPIYTPAAIPGLFLGCALSNLIIGGLGIIDLVFGSLATLSAAFCTYLMKKKSRFISLLPPIIINAVVVGAYLNYLISPEVSILINMGWVLLGQVVSCYCLGIPLCKVLDKYGKKYL